MGMSMDMSMDVIMGCGNSMAPDMGSSMEQETAQALG